MRVRRATAFILVVLAAGCAAILQVDDVGYGPEG
jgi:hypothetical protein